MTVDMPRPEQFSQLRVLWKQAFGDTDAFLDGFFATGFSRERCRCVTVDGTVAAVLYWFDCSWLEEKVAYIYAVATENAFRGKGLCRLLMEDTHRHLQRLGYVGAVLVPGDRGLFQMYEKLGYQGFSPKVYPEIVAGEESVSVRPLTAQDYGARRKAYLPAGGVIQEGATLQYLAAFADFYEAAGCVFCGGGEDGFYFQEFLGNREQLPGILKALQVEKALVPCPGSGLDSAMFYPLNENVQMPAYFGLPLN